MIEKAEQEKKISEVISKEMIFSKIKELQKLPDEVISQFLKSKGKLSQSDFTSRIKV